MRSHEGNGMNHKNRLNFEQFDNVVRKQKKTSRTEKKQRTARLRILH